jgi:pimeloyl-ACP methyl ester carboxylesterase
MTPSNCQLILLPGVCADARLFAPQRAEFPQLEVPLWPTPRPAESINDYADRLADAIAVRRPLVLGGMSFGGMVAHELARRLRPDALVLIATCRTRAGIRPVFRGLHAFYRLVPAVVYQWTKPLGRIGVATFRHLSAAQRQMCWAMYRDYDMRMMKWVLDAIQRWQPSPPADVPTWHIHGRRDLVIPAARVGADEWIADGGHLINLTHAAVVNALITRAIETAEGRSGATDEHG